VSNLTPQEFYELMVKQKDRCFEYMEGTDLKEFKRWEKLYCAYSTIVDDMD